MKRMIMTIAASVLCAALFFGCGQSNKTNGEKACSEAKSTDDSMVNGNVVVTLYPNFLSTLDEEKALLLSMNNPHATAAANKMDDFRGLIETYGYDLRTKEAVDAYNEIVDYIDSEIEQLTLEEQQYISQKLDALWQQ